MTTAIAKLYIEPVTTENGKKAAVMRFYPPLAAEIGVEQSILLLQISHWINSDQTATYEDGKWWIPLSVRDIWYRLAKCWSLNKINSLVGSMVANHLLLSRKGKRKSDPRNLAINPEKILCLESVQVLYPTETQARNTDGFSSDLGQGVPNRDTPTTPEMGARVPNGNTIRIYEDDDQKNNLSIYDNHPHDAQARACDPQEAAFMLMGAGLNGTLLQEAIEAAQRYQLTRDQIHTAIRDAQAGKRLEAVGSKRKVSVIPSYIRACIINNSIGTTYLDLEAEMQLAAKADQQREAELEALEAQRKTPEYLAAVQEQERQQVLDQAQAECEWQALLNALDQDAIHRKRDSSRLTYRDCWLAALGQIYIQFGRVTYNNWIAGAEAVGILTENDQKLLVVSVNNGYAKDWCETRLYRVIQASYARFSDEDIPIRFVVKPAQPRAYAFKPLPEDFPLQAESKTTPGESVVCLTASSQVQEGTGTYGSS